MSSGWQNLWAAWNWQPSIIIGCIGLMVAYFYAVNRWATVGAGSREPGAGSGTGSREPGAGSGAGSREPGAGTVVAAAGKAKGKAGGSGLKALWFTLGVLVIFVALVSPLDLIGEEYLFSVHMTQHLLLIEVAAPLLVLGIPASLVVKLLQHPRLKRLEWSLRQAPVAWILGIGTVYVWHIPALYNAALNDLPVHVAQHLFFLVTGVIFWWPVLHPIKALRLGFGAQLAYLFLAVAAGSILGMILTFVGPGMYPTYVKPFDRLGVLSLIRNDWGMTAANDQQLGGIIMWVPGSLVYMIGALGGLASWFADEGRTNEEAALSPSPTKS